MLTTLPPTYLHKKPEKFTNPRISREDMKCLNKHEKPNHMPHVVDNTFKRSAATGEDPVDKRGKYRHMQKTYKM